MLMCCLLAPMPGGLPAKGLGFSTHALFYRAFGLGMSCMLRVWAQHSACLTARISFRQTVLQHTQSQVYSSTQALAAESLLQVSWFFLGDVLVESADA